MNIPRIKFVFLFLVFGFAFVFGTILILNQPPESFLGAETQGSWQRVVSTILSPVKIVLLGPLVPFINFLHRDPDTPPPFFIAMFAAYWSVFAASLHFVIGKLKR